MFCCTLQNLLTRTGCRRRSGRQVQMVVRRMVEICGPVGEDSLLGFCRPRLSLGIFNDPTRLVPVTELLHFSPSSDSKPHRLSIGMLLSKAKDRLECSPDVPPALPGGPECAAPPPPPLTCSHLAHPSASRADPVLATVIPASIRLSRPAQNTAAAPVSPVLVQPPSQNTTFHI